MESMVRFGPPKRTRTEAMRFDSNSWKLKPEPTVPKWLNDMVSDPSAVFFFYSIGTRTEPAVSEPEPEPSETSSFPVPNFAKPKPVIQNHGHPYLRVLGHMETRSSITKYKHLHDHFFVNFGDSA